MRMVIALYLLAASGALAQGGPTMAALPPSQTEASGRFAALAALFDRATGEIVMLSGQVAELRAQLEQAKKQCTPVPDKK